MSRNKYCHTFHTDGFLSGFTLVELLVVVSIISLLLAIMLPALRKARAMASRTHCQGNLRQIAVAWLAFLNEHDGRFLQRVNANHDFGGWVGNGGFARLRPLNEYVGLEPETTSEKKADVFRCSADKGGIIGLPSHELAYHYFGNSYQTNFFLIGPDQVYVPPGNRKDLYNQINARLPNLNVANVSDPARLLLLGDNNWAYEWEPVTPHGKEWHVDAHHYNLAFLDGHADFIRIRKGLYVTGEYNALPFKDLYKMACEVQEEVPCEAKP
ncbi:MAG: prepilin-type N-terminal cleavage/methylation domain-containing protein [Planctomycetota bacterium]|nr:MAG: prepilin-type N-terminal cleavage/methylation domain-containing protein [Planctomycetota bacterium]